MGTSDGNGLLRDVREIVRRAVAIDIDQYRASFIEGCLQRRLKKLALGSVPEYVAYLRRAADEPRHFCAALSIYHSQFVRDREKYMALVQEILPQMIKRKRAAAGAALNRRDGGDPRPALRIWSAGCAGGEEPYSIAILVDELLGDEAAWWDVSIFAVDINETLVAKAAAGVYAEDELARKGMPQRFIAKYFSPAGGGMMRISDRLRRMVQFETADILSLRPYPSIDIIFCRNVLIYFNREAICRLLQGFHWSLASDGYLVLGNAELIEDSFMCYYRKIKCNGEFFYRKITPGSEEYREAVDRQATIRAGLGLSQ
jgi:chemotaxis methyl-accepting protein methylase